VLDALRQGAAEHGHVTDIWTLPRVRDLIHKLTGETYHEGHLGRLLVSLGFKDQSSE